MPKLHHFTTITDHIYHLLNIRKYPDSLAVFYPVPIAVLLKSYKMAAPITEEESREMTAKFVDFVYLNMIKS